MDPTQILIPPQTEVSQAFLLYGAILIGLSVGFLSSLIVIFGTRAIDDLTSGHNWSRETVQKTNRRIFAISAFILFFVTFFLIDFIRHFGPI